MDKKILFSLIFFTLLGWGIYYISGIGSVLQTALSFIIYSFIAYACYLIWKKVRKKENMLYLEFLQYFFYKLALGILVCILLLSGISYYLNEVSPTPMPTYTLSNGKKTVVFQTMSHIGTEEFYEAIRQNLTEKKQEGYVYYFEGVRDGTEENKKKFNEAIGIDFDPELYKNFSKLYGVVHQDNSIYLNLVNDKDFNIDLSIDEIMTEYKSSSQFSGKEKNSNNKKEVIDINSEVIKTLASLNDRELKILQYLNKAVLNFMIGSETTQKLIQDNFSNQDLFGVILDKRNEILSKKILESEHKKIFITYGLLHFKGVLEILQKNDQDWKIERVEYLYPIQ